MTATTALDLETELRELVALPGPVGAEDPVADWLMARLADLPVSPRRDLLGNLLIGSERGAPRVLITAHMDQVGYMVSRINQDRAVCLPLGSPQAEPSRAIPVRVVGETHRPLDGTFDSVGDLGGSVRSEQIEEICVGDRVVFVRPLESLGDDLVCGPALDDRVGCLLTLQAARMLGDQDGNLAFAWTVREETDQAGVIRASRSLEPDVVIAVDITPATPTKAGIESPISIGRGPAITLLDGGMVAHGPLMDTFDSAARALGITWQREVVRSGSSEAGRVQRSLGIPALPVLVPIDNAHSDREVSHLGDMLAAAHLLITGVEATLARLDGTPPRELVGFD
jgi:putative aminopeptidase FrvX